MCLSRPWTPWTPRPHRIVSESRSSAREKHGAFLEGLLMGPGRPALRHRLRKDHALRRSSILFSAPNQRFARRSQASSCLGFAEEPSPSRTPHVFPMTSQARNTSRPEQNAEGSGRGQTLTVDSSTYDMLARWQTARVGAPVLPWRVHLRAVNNHDSSSRRPAGPREATTHGWCSTGDVVAHLSRDNSKSVAS